VDAVKRSVIFMIRTPSILGVSHEIRVQRDVGYIPVKSSKKELNRQSIMTVREAGVKN